MTRPGFRRGRGAEGSEGGSPGGDPPIRRVLVPSAVAAGAGLGLLLPIGHDVQFSVIWPIKFPSAILIPPLATNVYHHTSGVNTVASVVSYNQTGATFVLDVDGGQEQTNGFSWLAIGF